MTIHNVKRSIGRVLGAATFTTIIATASQAAVVALDFTGVATNKVGAFQNLTAPADPMNGIPENFVSGTFFIDLALPFSFQDTIRVGSAGGQLFQAQSFREGGAGLVSAEFNFGSFSADAPGVKDPLEINHAVNFNSFDTNGDGQVSTQVLDVNSFPRHVAGNQLSFILRGADIFRGDLSSGLSRSLFESITLSNATHSTGHFSRSGGADVIQFRVTSVSVRPETTPTPADPVSAVPLPAGLPMLLAGLLGLGWAGKRRKALAA